MAQYDTQYTAIPDTPPPHRSVWPLAAVMGIDLVIIVIGGLVASILIQAVFMIANGVGQGVDLSTQDLTPQLAVKLLGPVGLFASMIPLYILCIGIPIARVGLLRPEPLSAIGFQLKRPLRTLGIGFLVGVLILLGNAALGLWFQSLGIQQNQTDLYPIYEGDYVGQSLFFIMAAVLAPVSEEVLCRGYIFGALRQSWQNRSWGIAGAYLVSATVFMLLHSLAATEGLIGLLVPTFFMGLLLAWSIHYTGSLVPCIIAHALNNSAAISILLYCTNNPGSCPNI